MGISAAPIPLDGKQANANSVAEIALAGDAFSISISQATHRVYIALPDTAGRPVLRVLEPVAKKPDRA